MELVFIRCILYSYGLAGSEGECILDGKKGWWVVFGAVWALTITAGVGFSSMGVLKDSIITDMGWSETEYMAGITYFGISSAIFSPFIGKAIDKFGS